MSELITEERIAVRSSNLVEGWPYDLPGMTSDQGQKVKDTRSRNVSAAIKL